LGTVEGMGDRLPNLTIADDPAAVPLRPAATVMLIRDSVDADGVDDIEVFMLRRTPKAAFAAGQYVFPGGRVDLADGADGLEGICDGLDDARASSILQIERGGLAFWVAAIRECFEEAGVLLARRAAVDPSSSGSGSGPRAGWASGLGDAIAFDDPVIARRFAESRRRVHDGELSLAQLCADEDLMLITDAIHYVSHWITPVGEVRRFDTRFFVARAPQAQEPLHDDAETVASLWVRPREAIDRFRAGELAMLPPTIVNLEFLLPFNTADEALEAAASVPTPAAVLPKIRVDAEGRVTALLMPGDDGYDDE
jgi:8-oxo-dGTP pyrophosphatase MutT (NUDIX family)